MSLHIDLHFYCHLILQELSIFRHHVNAVAFTKQIVPRTKMCRLELGLGTAAIPGRRNATIRRMKVMAHAEYIMLQKRADVLVEAKPTYIGIVILK